MVNVGDERKWIADTNNERFVVVEDKGFHCAAHYFVIQYDTDGRKQTVSNQDLELKTVVLPTQINRDKLIDDLNSILKDNFDYVPFFKVVNVADELIKRGWKLYKQ